MTRRTKSVLKYLLSTAMTFFFLYFAYQGTDFPKLWLILKDANY